MMLLVMAAVAFFLFRGMGGGIMDREGNPQQKQQPADNNEPWRGERQTQPRINIPGVEDQNASDEVQARDGWSMKDADQSDANDNRQFQFSNQEEQAAETDEVKKDDWSMKDRDDGKRDQRRDQ
ncbi:MAG: hypothetical protein ACR2NP_13695 [Pirellulaceae bacterium]